MSKDLEKKSDKELRELLTKHGAALREFRFSTAGSRVRNIREGRNTRKEVARILTELRQRGTA